MAVSSENLYLHSAELSGYKTIKKTFVEFKPGLNVIIGINGVGKTNFLTFLNKALNEELQNLNEVHAKLLLRKGEQEIEIFSESKINYDKGDSTNSVAHTVSQIIDTKLLINKNQVPLKESDGYVALFSELRQNSILIQSSIIQHGIPLEYFDIIDKPYNFSLDNDYPTIDIKFTSKSRRPYFIKSLFSSVFLNTLRNKPIEEKSVKFMLKESFNIIEKIKEPLRNYSPITDVRLNENINISKDKEKNTLNIGNIFLEFKIGDSWLPFSSLSDGTKRMFYIVAEVACPGIFYFIENGFGFINDNENLTRIILLEEPELGIHPHQLFKLMKFLKEESREKQIIISTHSPQILDSLIEFDDLDRIIIASEDKEKGTQLRHLDEKEIKKAKLYMSDEGFLSDYWTHSDLEFKYR